MKVCIIAEIENEGKNPPDEGKRKFAFYLAKELRNLNGVEVLELRNSKRDIWEKLMWHPKFIKAVTDFKPEVIFFIPTNMKNLIFYRLKVIALKFFYPKSKIVLLSLQPMGYYSVVEKVVKFLLPNLIFVQSLIEKQNLENIGCNVKLIPSGVDLNKFNPVSERTKTVSRRKHNVKPIMDPIIRTLC